MIVKIYLLAFKELFRFLRNHLGGESFYKAYSAQVFICFDVAWKGISHFFPECFYFFYVVRIAIGEYSSFTTERAFMPGFINYFEFPTIFHSLEAHLSHLHEHCIGVANIRIVDSCFHLFPQSFKLPAFIRFHEFFVILNGFFRAISPLKAEPVDIKGQIARLSSKFILKWRAFL